MNFATRTVARLLLATLLAFEPLHTHAWAYEVLTHGRISVRAYQVANIDAVLAEELGISGEDPLSESSQGMPRTPVEWVRQGSIDEDDGIRFVNHFYDPVFNRGLTATVTGLPIPIPVAVRGTRSHEWGLEVPAEFAEQEFSYKDAREYYWRSLTEAKREDRERWLATTFLTLGHVIHLIQDLASPPHTRNAPHGGRRIIAGAIGVNLGPPSVVERHLDTIRDELIFDGYPIPRVGFATPRDFLVETDASGLPPNVRPGRR